MINSNYPIRKFSHVLIFFLSLLLANCNNSSQIDEQDYLLWYNEPATEWIDALPVGNGRLGAMVFGDTDLERIQFNEESLWAGSVVDNNNPDALKYLTRIQQLIFEGDYKLADELAWEHMVGTPPRVRSYQTFGDLFIDYKWETDVKNYRRELNLHTGVVLTEFDAGENRIRQEVFASAPHDLIVIRITGSGPFDLDIALKREKDAVITSGPEGEIILTGQIVDEEDPDSGPAGAHMNFASIARVKVGEGTFNRTNTGISCNDINTLTIYLSAATNYSLDELNFTESVDALEECNRRLENISDLSWSEVKEAHIADHSRMFGRVSLNLGVDTLSNLPTDQRLARVKEGETDNGLVATYFQYGRYLLMGSSRNPGRLPANLQGVWNDRFQAAWDSDFHTNINLQMNYWPAEICNLSETSLVLAKFMKQIAVPGAVTARKMYDTEGWTMHHLTDPFGRTGVADGVWGITPLDGPWMMFPLYRHFEFTLDTSYLKEIYPLIRGAAEFVLDYLISSPEGYLVTSPSHSPENAFFVPGTNKEEQSKLTYAATIDIQIINRLFDIASAALKIVDPGDQEFIRRMTIARKKLPPIRIGENGTIQEWIHDYEEVQVGHRHMSHLLGLYPLSQITPATPKLFEAARKTIERRLAGGGGHTGWSRAWIINFYARLQDGEAAWDHVQQLLAKTTLDNLFNTHPPFQIDGNFGGTAGIAEMLIQSHNGKIRLLPALPEAWPEGAVTGIKARGGFECDLFWSDGKLDEAVIYSRKGGKTEIEYAAVITEIDLKPGGKFVYRPK